MTKLNFKKIKDQIKPKNKIKYQINHLIFNLLKSESYSINFHPVYLLKL